ncbi:MAG: glycosyltransferase family 9 protein, partial [Flavobacteriales bacterium]
DHFLNADEWKVKDTNTQVYDLSQLQIDTTIHVFPDAHWMRLACQAKIPIRVATAHRVSSWRWCSHRVAFSRRKSDLHEAQLNFKLLKPLGLSDPPSIDDIHLLYGFGATKEQHNPKLASMHQDKMNICLHPFSQGSAVEWSLRSFQEFVQLFDPHSTHFYITGTSSDKARYQREGGISAPHVTCVMGEMTLQELISFIAQSDGMIAASTGPLHIAAALQVSTVGVYSSARPIHAGRWAPLGKYAEAIEDHTAPTSGTLAISPEAVKLRWEELYQRKTRERN